MRARARMRGVWRGRCTNRWCRRRCRALPSGGRTMALRPEVNHRHAENDVKSNKIEATAMQDLRSGHADLRTLRRSLPFPAWKEQDQRVCWLLQHHKSHQICCNDTAMRIRAENLRNHRKHILVKPININEREFGRCSNPSKKVRQNFWIALQSRPSRPRTRVRTLSCTSQTTLRFHRDGMALRPENARDRGHAAGGGGWRQQTCPPSSRNLHGVLISIYS